MRSNLSCDRIQSRYGIHRLPFCGFNSVCVSSFNVHFAMLNNVSTAIMSNVFLGGFDGTITASTYAVISSEFNAANTASWLTTSYLITSTAFQPLYGRFSDILGRRACFFTATISFMAGCLGCAIAKDIVFLNIMRALTGIGGGGLMTMGTLNMMGGKGNQLTQEKQPRLSTRILFHSDDAACIRLSRMVQTASVLSAAPRSVGPLLTRLDGDGVFFCRSPCH